MLREDCTRGVMNVLTTHWSASIERLLVLIGVTCIHFID
jgi:hypothetical protein